MTQDAHRRYVRLSAMMFLEFAAKGAWFVVMAGHMARLGFSGRQIGYVYATGALGAVISPLFAGWLADRFLSAQKLLACCHLLAGVVLLITWKLTHFAPFWCGIFTYAVLTSPTLALINAISFHHMEDSRRFGHLRAWGTAGWMCANWALGLYLWYWESAAPGSARLSDALAGGALLSLAMAAYCLTLPPTPPSPGTPKSPYGFLRNLRLTAEPRFAVLLATCFMAGAVLPFFYNFTFLFLTDAAGGIGLTPSRATLAITLAQVAEIGFLVILSFALRHFGMRITLAVGLAGLIARAAVFASGRPTWLVIAAQGLHGLDYAFFFVAVVIAAEQLSDRAQRASTQALMVFSTYGLGMLAGHFLSGAAYDLLSLPSGRHDWRAFFTCPLVILVPGLIAFLSLYRHPAPGESP